MNFGAGMISSDGLVVLKMMSQHSTLSSPLKVDHVLDNGRLRLIGTFDKPGLREPPGQVEIPSASGDDHGPNLQSTVNGTLQQEAAYVLGGVDVDVDGEKDVVRVGDPRLHHVGGLPVLASNLGRVHSGSGVDGLIIHRQIPQRRVRDHIRSRVVSAPDVL